MPTAVRNISAIPSSPESINITWDHPEYPNSQLLNYIIYYNSTPEIVGITLNHNLTNLTVFTYYTIRVTVNGQGVGNAPFDGEILQRTNASGEIVVVAVV